MGRRRSVSLLIGKKSYNLITSMSDDKLKKVYDLLRDVMANTDSGLEQDEWLFIACMTLASELTSISDRMRDILLEAEPGRCAEKAGDGSL
ncbi:MAG: cell division protein ZapA [Synergistaceae bacterium]|jgi:hypothetical protein|nr:cell division protein ZapA [Synergistaceae bacterium]